MENTKFIIEADGTLLLINEKTRQEWQQSMHNAQRALNDIRQLLVELELDITHTSIDSIADGGQKALEEILRQRTEQDIKRLHISKTTAHQWRNSCLEGITPNVAERANAASDSIKSFLHACGIADIRLYSRFSVERGVVLDKKELEERFNACCTYVATEEERERARQLANITADLREMEEEGINALQIVGEMVKCTEIPEEGWIVQNIVEKRHQPGTIYDPAAAQAINELAIKNLNARVLGN